MGKLIWKIVMRHDSTIMTDFVGAAALFVSLIVAMHLPLLA